MNGIEIKRGDSYPIELSLYVDNERITDTETLEKLEVTMGKTSYLWRSTGGGRITFDPKNTVFVFTPSQSETFALPLQGATLDWRVKFADDTVRGEHGFIPIMVYDSQSKAVL
ncbi:MAG: hypothetical protein IIZ93_16360 [Acidaminococcaceae bacterium]|nr:hypothetical protein [Acidaminococcaceae bacterium]